MIKQQQKTGQSTEYKVKELLEAQGLIVKKPIPDKGIDFEVSCKDKPEKIIRVQIKGRGCIQKNRKYRWFQIRTTSKQRDDARKAGLDKSEAWRKKVDLCDFFIFVSEKENECWVFPKDIVIQIIQINKSVYGNREDNKNGIQAEMDLDIQHDGKALNEPYAEYKNNTDIIKNKLMN
jgi:hypothetical protein